MAFQVWLQFAGEVAGSGDGVMSQRPPEQLPVVLQVLLSQVRVWTFGPPYVLYRGLISEGGREGGRAGRGVWAGR